MQMRMKDSSIRDLGIHLASLPVIRQKIDDRRELTFDDLRVAIKADKKLPQVQSDRTLGMVLEAICELG